MRDLGAFIVRLVEEAVAGTFNAAGPARTTTMRELLAEVQRGVGGDARLTWVSARFLEEQGLKPWEDLPAWVPRPEGATQVSNARALAAGLSLRPIADTARDTLAWWRTLPEERRSRPKVGPDPAREAKVLAAWKDRR